MKLRELSIVNCRNIKGIDLQALADINFIHGPNGSGKTSILESLHTLSVSHSFRTRKIKSLVSHGEDALVVRGLLDNDHYLAVQRSQREGTIVKYQRERLSSAGQLAGLLPVLVINPDSFSLVEGAPSLRRQFLDWSVFHVKHMAFYTQWSRYRRALQQRNSLLRRGRISQLDVEVWDREIAQSGELIQQFRLHQFELFRTEFDQVVNRLICQFNSSKESVSGGIQIAAPGGDGLSLALQPGWDTRLSLLEDLQQNFDGDLRQGHTRYGPHRGDISIRIGGVAAAEVLSRGQIKTLVSALKISQCRVLESQGGVGLVLIDDLPAELDMQRRKALFTELIQLKSQIFASSICSSDLDERWCGGRSVKRFHVKHGELEVGG